MVKVRTVIIVIISKVIMVIPIEVMAIGLMTSQGQKCCSRALLTPIETLFRDVVALLEQLSFHRVLPVVLILAIDRESIKWKFRQILSCISCG